MAVYAYLCVPVADALGLAWLQRGTMHARFLQPLYHGDEAVVEPRRPNDAESATIELTLRRDNHDVCAIGRASLDTQSRAVPDASSFPVAPLPAVPPGADAARLAPGTVLGSFEHRFRLEDPFPLMESPASTGTGHEPVAGDHSLFGQHKVANPAQLVALANDILVRNASLGPWLHVESEVECFTLVRDGTLISARGRVSKQYERRGHHFVELDVFLVDDAEKPLQRIRHVAIYQLRQPGR